MKVLPKSETMVFWVLFSFQARSTSNLPVSLLLLSPRITTKLFWLDSKMWPVFRGQHPRQHKIQSLQPKQHSQDCSPKSLWPNSDLPGLRGITKLSSNSIHPTYIQHKGPPMKSESQSSSSYTLIWSYPWKVILLHFVNPLRDKLIHGLEVHPRCIGLGRCIEHDILAIPPNTSLIRLII